MEQSPPSPPSPTQKLLDLEEQAPDDVPADPNGANAPADPPIASPPVPPPPSTVSPNSGQPMYWGPYPWAFPANPWVSQNQQAQVSQSTGEASFSLGPGPTQNAQAQASQFLGGPSPSLGAGSNYGPGQLGAGQTTTDSSPSGLNPYPIGPPGFFPYPLPAASNRPELGDPLYTAAADGPELRLISHQLKGPDNYSVWSREFRRALVTKDKDGFLDGTVPVPTDQRFARHWRKCNQLVRTWIGNCLSPEVAAGLPPTEDSKVIWDNIKEMYGKLDRAKIYSLTQKLCEFKQGNLSVASCFNQLSAFWNELEAAEEKLEGPEDTQNQYRRIKEREKVTRFLLTLNDTYMVFRSQILAMEPVPPLGRIYQLAVQEESQRFASSEQGKLTDGIAWRPPEQQHREEEEIAGPAD